MESLFYSLLENYINADLQDFTFLGNDFSFSLFLLKLLARLEGRRSLKEIEPCLFVDEDEPVHGKNTTSKCRVTN